MILFAGFIVVGAALIVEVVYQPPFWVHAVLWVPLILVVTLLPLRPIKGLLIALQYHHKAAEGRLERERAVSAPAEPRRGARLVLFARVRAHRCARGADRARHLAARAQGLEGRPDRRARPASSRRRRAACRRASAGRSSTPQTDEYRRVTFAAEFVHDQEALVYTSRLGAAARRQRPRLLGAHAGAAHRRQRRDGQSRLRAGGTAGSENAAAGQPSTAPIEIVGALRWPEARGRSRRPTTRRTTSGSRAIPPRWRRRKAGATSRRSTSSRRRRPRRAACRRPGRSKPSLPNNHLQYAVTWYGLALVVADFGDRCSCARGAAGLPDKL